MIERRGLSIIRVPGDKSISHRALMLAPFAQGTSRIRGLASGADVGSTAAAMRALGAQLAEMPGPDALIEVSGPTALRSPQRTIDCGNSGTSARLLLGLIAGSSISATLDGDASLRRRPMARVVDPLGDAGARFRELGEHGRLPLESTGGQLRPIEHETPVASAQVKSALLMAGLAAGVPALITEPGPSRNHTELMLRGMGANITTEETAAGWRIAFVPAAAPLEPLDMRVPGDFSSAAFWLALAILGGCGDGVRIEGVGLNTRRTGFIRVAEAMGASLDVRVTGEEGGGRGRCRTLGAFGARNSTGVDAYAHRRDSGDRHHGSAGGGRHADTRRGGAAGEGERSNRYLVSQPVGGGSEKQ